MTIAQLNATSPDQLLSELLRCCGSTRWADQVAAARPFTGLPPLLAAADSALAELSRDDLLEAFSHHPRIGERNLDQLQFAPTSAWSQKEQSGMVAATDDTRRRFIDLNHAYEARFGHVFLICATGKSADQMLAAIESRLANDPDSEFRAAAAELRQITRLRLEKLVNPP